MNKEPLFALDIGTRSVVGLVGEADENGIRLVAADRQEHHTRAMLDGQIHDVPLVSAVIREVKSRLEQRCGPLQKVAVAAAGRSLYTIKAQAEIDAAVRGFLTAQDEQSLELAALQTAQRQLASSTTLPDPTLYYCVGYSVVSYTLDGNPLKSLVGQRGKTAGIELIATFLPRQVIDSLQSAVEAAGLQMNVLTLEPIAAISVLIPPTMRHLNLALVDVGAGTSDVALTRDGSVVGYGMAPVAGDEITEAISQQYLLDFNVAETVKRHLSGKQKKIACNDVLGMHHKIDPQEIIKNTKPSITDLARAIADQILSLNSSPPQAVLLVGGGSLTPLLAETLAAALDIPASRVAIRRPDNIDGILDIPPNLKTPDAVTPLGILKLAGSRTLHFIHVRLNDQPLRLFNLGKLTVADALLASGVDVRLLQGRPGLGMTITVNGKTQFFPGSLGRPGKVLINGCEAGFADAIQDQDVITVTKGSNGQSPSPVVRDVVAIPEPLTVTIDGRPFRLPPLLTANDAPAQPETALKDRDSVVCLLPQALAEVLTAAGQRPETTHLSYTVNGADRVFHVCPKYRINDTIAGLSSPVRQKDSIQIQTPPLPPVGQILGLAAPKEEYVAISFNGSPCRIPVHQQTLLLNGRPARPEDQAPAGSRLECSNQEKHSVMVSDALLAARFDPRSLSPASRIAITVNGQAAEYTTPVKSGDEVQITAIS